MNNYMKAGLGVVALVLTAAVCCAAKKAYDETKEKKEDEKKEESSKTETTSEETPAEEKEAVETEDDTKPAPADSLFTRTYNAAEKEVPFDPGWRNDTGYYNYAVTADLGLEDGEIAKSFDPDSRRRILLIAKAIPKEDKTVVEQQVVFDRYTDYQHDVQVRNVSKFVGKWMNQTGQITDAGLQRILDYSIANMINPDILKARLDEMLEEMKQSDFAHLGDKWWVDEFVGDILPDLAEEFYKLYGAKA